MQVFLSKIYNFVKNSNHTLLVFCLFGIRAGIFGASIGDSIFFIGFLSFLSYDKFLKTIKINDINESTINEIKEIKSQLSLMQMRNIVPSQASGQTPIAQPKRFF